MLAFVGGSINFGHKCCLQSHTGGQHPEDVDRSGPDLNAAANMLPKGSDKTTDALDSTLEKLPPRYLNAAPG